MEKLSKLFLVVLITLDVMSVQAQSLTALKDTIYCTIADHTNQQFTARLATGSSAGTYSWKVIDCNFPAAWTNYDRSAVCDENICRDIAVLWPSGRAFTMEQFSSFDTTSNLELVFDTGAAALGGCYYVTVGLYNIAVPTDSTTETFSVCSTPASVPQITPDDKLVLYPNPVNDLLNIVFDGSSGIITAVVCDFSGKEIIKQHCGQGMATLQVGNIPNGIYLLKFVDNNGLVVARKEFVKE